MTEAVVRCSARAALAGNPSDGFGGAVLAVPVPHWTATVRATPAARFELAHSPTADDTFDDLAALRHHVARHGTSGARELLLATVATLADHLGLHLSPRRLDVSSAIPRGVGLGGSSAIVIASIRSLLASAGAPELPPDELSALALAVETEGLGIRAGLQDRVVQSYDAPVMMRFDAASNRRIGRFEVGTYEALAPAAPIDVLVAARAAAAEPSDVPHGDLRARDRSDDPSFRRAVDELAASAVDAAAAWREGDVRRLGAAMDRTFDVRRSMMALRADHIELVDTARAAGCSANYAGSGGSISVVGPDLPTLDAADHALRRLGCETTTTRFT